MRTKYERRKCSMANRPNPKKRNISSSDDESGPSVPNKTNKIVKTESTESVSQDTVEIILL